MPKVSFTTLGCRLNQAESDAMAEDLAAAGVTVAAPGEAPDMVVVNTCTVTREATKASRMALRRAVKNNPGAKVVAIGCYAVSDPDEIRAIEGVTEVLDNEAKERLPEVLGATSSFRPLLQIGGLPKRSLPHRVRANLKVQTGCDEWCSFCIIPRTRGPLRSFASDDLVDEARAKVAAGARELVLTGVHLGKYTYDTGGDESALVALFERLLAIRGVWRLRLSSILSEHLTEEVVSFMAGEPRMCRFLHVPLQSGDDGMLRAMNRPYDLDGYMASIERVRGSMPSAALATDIIVGHPGESDEAFANTLRVVEEVRFSKLHVFRYSERADTAAARLPDDVPPDVKKARSKTLIDLGNEIRRTFLEEHLRRPLEVLVEDERDGVCSGQTDTYVRVWFEGEGLLGRMVEVRGHEIRADGIRGADVIGTVM